MIHWTIESTAAESALGEVHYGWVRKHLQEMMGFQVCSHQIVGVESTTICFKLEFQEFSNACY